MKKDTLPQGQEKSKMVRTMFDRIAPKYDLMNRILSFGMDQHWRQKGLQEVHIGPQDIVLDLACGTGDLSLLSASYGAKVIGLDFSAEMLRAAEMRRGEANATFVKGDAACLPFSNSSISLVVCGFALRNFIDLNIIFKEIGRILIPSGRFMFLEVYQPSNRWVKMFHSLYFEKTVPLIGALISDKNAYAYLPRSVTYLPKDEKLVNMLESAGLGEIQHRKLFLGAAQMITGKRV